MSRVLSPLDMVAVEASGKGVMLHMIGGEAHFEYLVLTQMLAEFPGLFYRAGRSWLVRNNQVAGYTYKRPGHDLLLHGSDLRIPVSRREWPAVANRLGLKIPPGRFVDDKAGAAAHMTHVRAACTRQLPESRAMAAGVHRAASIQAVRSHPAPAPSREADSRLMPASGSSAFDDLMRWQVASSLKKRGD